MHEITDRKQQKLIKKIDLTHCKHLVTIPMYSAPSPDVFDTKLADVFIHIYYDENEYKLFWCGEDFKRKFLLTKCQCESLEPNCIKKDENGLYVYTGNFLMSSHQLKNIGSTLFSIAWTALNLPGHDVYLKEYTLRNLL